MKIKLKIFLPGLFFVTMITLWELIPKAFNIAPYIFPSFTKVVVSTFYNNSELGNYFFTTVTEAFLGFLLGSIIGFLIGVLMSENEYFSLISLPYVIASNAIPVIAIAPIIIMWFGNGLFSKVVVSAFLCFFPLAINTFKGLTLFSNSFKELFDIYGASKLEFLWNFKLRNSLPFIFAGLKLNATFSVIGGVVGEIIASNAGLGYGILQSVYSLNIPKLWGYVLLSCILGTSFYLIIHLIEKQFKF